MKKKTLHILAVCLLNQLAIAERPLNEIPMRGGLESTLERNPEFSRHATQLGWDYYYQGDYNTAIKRFNQGWMFDQENSEVYWGFGLIMGQRASEESPKHNLEESIRFLQMACDKAPDHARIIADLAFSHTVLGHYFQSEERDHAEAQRNFETAETLFAKAFKMNPNYPPLVANWSILCFYRGDYALAKTKADQAMELGYQFSPAYLAELETKTKLDCGPAATAMKSKTKLNLNEAIEIALPEINKAYPGSSDNVNDYTAFFENGIWTVSPNLPEGVWGGGPSAEVSDRNGVVIRTLFTE